MNIMGYIFIIYLGYSHYIPMRHYKPMICPSHEISRRHSATLYRRYLDRGIPYRRGYLLHGPPGCGKPEGPFAHLPKMCPPYGTWLTIFLGVLCGVSTILSNIQKPMEKMVVSSSSWGYPNRWMLDL